MSVTLTFDLQVAKALQGLASVIAKEQQYDDALIKTIGITRDQAKANAEWIRQHKEAHDLAMAFKKQEASAIEAYKKALIEEGQLDNRIAKDKRQADEQLAAQKKANIDSYKRELIAEAQLDIKMARDRRAENEQTEKQATSALDRRKQAYRSLIAEVMRMHPTEQQATREYIQRQQTLAEAVRTGTITQQQYNSEIARMNHEFRGGSQAQGTFLDKLAGVASTYLTVSRALGEIQKAMSAVRQEADESLALIQARSQTMGEIAQVAQGKTTGAISADINQMVGEAGSAATKYGWNYQDTLKARREARNASADAQFDDIMKYAHITRNPELVAQAVGQFRHNFGNEDLGFKEIANTALIASHGSPVNLEDVFGKLGQASVTAKNIGSSSGEFMAYFSALAKGYGNANMAADRLSYLISKGQMEGLGGEGIGGVVAKIAAMPVEEREKDIGKRKELNETLNILNDPATKQFVKQQNAAVAEAKALAQSPDSPLEIRRRAYEQSAEGKAVITVNQAKAADEISRQKVGLDEAARKVNRLAVQGSMRDQGISAPVRGYGKATGDWLSDYLPTGLAGAADWAGVNIARGFGMNFAGTGRDAHAQPQEATTILGQIRDLLRSRPLEPPKAARSAAQAQGYYYGGGM